MRLRVSLASRGYFFALSERKRSLGCVFAPSSLGGGDASFASAGLGYLAQPSDAIFFSRGKSPRVAV